MIRLLPRTPRGTWLLAGAVWLVGCGALWWVLPYRPRASWPTDNTVVHGFIPGTAFVLTSSPPLSAIQDGWPGDTMLGPLLARDAATGAVREWLPANEPLTLVRPGVDGKHVLIGRVVDGRARLFLHDGTDGQVIAEQPHGGPRAGNEIEQPAVAHEPFAAFRPGGRQIAYAGLVYGKPGLRVWDVETRREVAALSDAGPPAAWSPDGACLAYLSQPQLQDGWTARLLDLNAGQVRVLSASPETHPPPDRLVFSGDGKTVVGAHVHKVATDLHVRVFVAWDATPGAGANGRRLEIGGLPSGVPFSAVLHVAAPSEPELFPRLGGTTEAEFLSAATTRGVEVFPRLDRATRNEYRSFNLPRDFRLPAADEFFLCHTYSPDGRWLFVTARHTDPILELLRRPLNEVVTERPHLWDTREGRLRYSLPMTVDSTFGNISQYCWSPDGTLLAIAGNDQLAVWDIPPRRSLTWLAAGAMLFSLPPFLIARRRVRRLRREAAA
jgi:WD40 repeat protein